MKSKNQEVAHQVNLVVKHYLAEDFTQEERAIGLLYAKIPGNIRKYVTKNEVDQIIHDNVFFRVRKMLSSSNKSKKQELSAGEQKELSKEIARIIMNIPFKYQICFPLPFTGETCKFDCEDVSIKPLKLSGMFPETADISNQCIWFTETGYFNNQDDNALYLMVLADFKQFVYLAAINGLIQLRDPRALSNINEFRFRMAILDKTNRKNTLRVIPEGIAGLVKKIEFKSDNHQLMKIMRPLVKFIYSEGTDVKPIQFAAELAFDALATGDGTMRFINRCIAIEAILGEGKDDEQGLTAMLSDRCAYLLGKGFSARNDLRKSFKKMYNLRSKVIHGRKKLEEKDRETIAFQEEILDEIIRKEIKNIEYH